MFTTSKRLWIGYIILNTPISTVDYHSTLLGRVGMKEITTGLLAAALADPAITQAGMDGAKAVAIAALEREIATLQQQR